VTAVILREFNALEHDTDSTVYISALLCWELYNKECGKGLTECNE